MTRRQAVRRAAIAVALGAGTLVGTTIAGLEPRPVAVLLVVALAVVALGLLNDAVGDQVPAWFPAPVHPSLTRGRDAVTVAHARQIESHLSSRTPDAAVRDRLATLADEVLLTRHGVTLGSSEGERLLGHEVAELLTGRVRRLSLRTIDQCLRTIEEL